MPLDLLVNPIIDPKTGAHIAPPPSDIATSSSSGPRDLLADKQRFSGAFDTGSDKPALQASLNAKVARDVPGTGESIAQGVGQGASFGWLDELVGLADAEAGKQLKERLRLAKAAHPIATGAGEVAGMIAPMIVAPELGGAKVGAGLLAKAGMGAAKNAVAAGIYGAGASDGNVQDRLTAGADSAAIGAAVGGAAPMLLKGASLVGGALQAPVRAVVGGLKNPEKEAAQRVVAALGRDAGDPQRAVNTLTAAKAAGVPMIAADTGVVSQALARSAANASPEARAVLDRTISDRFGTQNVRAATVIRNLVRTPANATLTRDALGILAKNSRKPFYDRAYQQGASGVWTPQLERLTQAPPMQTAIRGAAATAATKEVTGRLTPSLNANGHPTLEFWDYVKRNLDDQVGVALRAGEKSRAADLTELRTQLVNELDSAVPSYATARGVAATLFKANDALDAGEKFVNSPMANEEARAALGKMTQAEQTLFREGFVSKLIDNIMGTRDRVSLLNSINASEKARERIRMVLGPSGARELETLMRVESIMDMTREALKGNSTTVRQLLEMGLAGTAGFTLGGANIYDPKSWIAAIVGAGGRKGLYVIDQRVTQRIGEMMASQDPQVIQKAINMVTSNPRIMDMFRKASTMLSRAVVPVESGKVPDMLGAANADQNGQPRQTH